MKKKDLLFLLISSVILVIAWITFSILHNSISSTINETLNAQLAPISGTFDTKTIATLKKRQQITALFSNPVPSPSVTPTPSPTLQITATPSAVITPTLAPSPNASEGGSLLNL